MDWDDFRGNVRQAQDTRARGNLVEAADLLREALRLWQGTPLGGARGDFVDQERTRLSQHRVAVLEERLAVELELGRHVEVSEELAAAVAAEPVRERLRELQMIALYRSGRQAEALTAYEDMRRLLATELGVDPGAGLRQVHQRILRGDPALAAPAPSPPPVLLPERPPAQVPAALPGFVGRQVELAGIQGTLRPAGGTRVVAISGLAAWGRPRWPSTPRTTCVTGSPTVRSTRTSRPRTAGRWTLRGAGLVPALLRRTGEPAAQPRPGPVGLVAYRAGRSAGADPAGRRH